MLLSDWKYWQIFKHEKWWIISRIGWTERGESENFPQWFSFLFLLSSCSSWWPQYWSSILTGWSQKFERNHPKCLWFIIFAADRLEDRKLALIAVNGPILQMLRPFWFLLFEMGLPGGKLNVPYVFQNNSRHICNCSKALNFWIRTPPEFSSSSMSLPDCPWTILETSSRSSSVSLL